MGGVGITILLQQYGQITAGTTALVIGAVLGAVGGVLIPSLAFQAGSRRALAQGHGPPPGHPGYPPPGTYPPGQQGGPHQPPPPGGRGPVQAQPPPPSGPPIGSQPGPEADHPDDEEDT